VCSNCANRSTTAQLCCRNYRLNSWTPARDDSVGSSVSVWKINNSNNNNDNIYLGRLLRVKEALIRYGNMRKECVQYQTDFHRWLWRFIWFREWFIRHKYITIHTCPLTYTYCTYLYVILRITNCNRARVFVCHKRARTFFTWCAE
jgi:hypothetical protein